MLVQIVLIQIIAFVVLILLLRRLFYKNLNSAVNRLKSLHQENLVKEEELKDRLRQAQEEYDRRVEEGKARAKEIVESAKRQAQRVEADLRDSAQKKADRIVQRGQEKVDKVLRNLDERIRLRAVEFAMEMVELTFSSAAKEILHRQFTDELIREIRKLDAENFTVKKDKIKVISAYRLSPGEIENLKDALSRKVGATVELSNDVDKGLIAGFVVQIESLIIDGSLKNRLERLSLGLRSAHGGG